MSKCLRILIVILIIIFNVVPVFSADSGTVTITATPLMSTGILNFMMIYTSNTKVDFTWAYGTDVDRIMIRGKYGNYPNNIPDINTAPTDGYLIYYGNGINASDTSVNFDENPGPLYVSAWGQKLDGTWEIIPNQDNKESKELILLSFVILVIGLIAVNVMARISFTPLRLVAAFAWTIPIIWVIGYPPSFIVTGSNIQVAVIVVLIGMFLISMFGSFRGNMQITTTSSKGNTSRSISAENGGWHLPSFMQSQDSPEATRARRMNNLNDYRERAHSAIYGARRRDRGGRYID